MRLSLAVLLFVGIPEKVHMFQHIIPLFFCFFFFLGEPFRIKKGYCCHVLLFAIVMDSVVVGSWIQKSQCVEQLSPGNWEKAYRFEHSRCKL